VILLVEDEAIIRTEFALLLRRQGFDVVESPNGDQAVRLLDIHEIDLVITDLVLPQVHGLSLIDRIRERRPRMPVILISGYMSQRAGDAIAATWSGAGEITYFRKPVRPSALVASVKHLLKSAT
jgi:DNA-binding NtrC family response regulator